MTDEIPPRSRLTRRELLRFGSLAAAGNGVTFVVDTISAAPLNKVTATINSSEASGGRLFGRLMGTKLP